MKNCRTEFSPDIQPHPSLLLILLQIPTTTCPLPSPLEQMPLPKATLMPSAIGFTHFIPEIIKQFVIYCNFLQKQPPIAPLIHAYTHTHTHTHTRRQAQTNRPLCYFAGWVQKIQDFLLSKNVLEMKKKKKNV